MLYQKYLLGIGLYSFQTHLRQDKGLQGDKIPIHENEILAIVSLNEEESHIA